MAEMVELRCQSHLHGKLGAEVIEVRCGQCSKKAGEPVYHYFRKSDGQMVDPEDIDGAAPVAAPECQGVADTDR